MVLVMYSAASSYIVFTVSNLELRGIRYKSYCSYYHTDAQWQLWFCTAYMYIILIN